jgi:hypothetical protein
VSTRPVAPVDWAAPDVLPYRLVTKDDFKARSSGSLWGNVAHGAEICTHILPAADPAEAGTFRAVMKQDCSFWNKVVGPLGTAGLVAGLFSPVPVVVPVKQPDWYILQHEQIHFAINETAARQLSREIAELPPEKRTPSRIQAAYRVTLDHVQKRHAEFDGETSGSYSPAKLEKWVRVMEIQMQRLCGEGPHCQVRQARR